MDGASSTPERLAKLAEAQEKQKQETQEQVNRLKAAADAIFSSENGKLWAREAIKVLGVNKRVEKQVFANLAVMASRLTAQDFYEAMFKGVLKPEVLSAIERGE